MSKPHLQLAAASFLSPLSAIQEKFSNFALEICQGAFLPSFFGKILTINT